MSDIQKSSGTDKENAPQLKGLYKNVNITVKTLNLIIIACVLLVILVVAMDLREPGLTVTFDAMGGTDVAAQTQMYGEALALPDSPTREGYAFTGWYKDYACYEPWDMATDTIQSDMSLYAGWQKLQ